jgi:hypothetical protein
MKCPKMVKSSGFRVKTSVMPADSHVAAMTVSSTRLRPSRCSCIHLRHWWQVAVSYLSSVTSAACAQKSAMWIASGMVSGLAKRLGSVATWRNSARIPRLRPKERPLLAASVESFRQIACAGCSEMAQATRKLVSMPITVRFLSPGSHLTAQPGWKKT